MLTRINKARADREGGFTLIELLVVVAIIAILAVIAIPIFNNFRDNAANSAAQSEAKSAATLLETSYTESGDYPAAQADLDALNIRASDNTVILVTGNAAGYTLKACSISTGTEYVWVSTAGSFTVVDGTANDCAAGAGGYGVAGTVTFAAA
jgi:prepilin-type N-terminal cleavage/methylation domain-containing protein